MTHIPDLVSKLQVRLASLGDGRDLKSDNEKALWHADRVTTQSVISGLMNIPGDLEKPQRLLRELEAEREAHLAERTEIETQIAVVPAAFANSSDRDREHDRQTHLRRQLELLHRGELWRAPGITYQRLTDLDARIAELQLEIERLHARHAGFVQQAEALLALPVTS